MIDAIGLFYMEYGSSMAETLINVINIFYTDRGFIIYDRFFMESV